jgi:hypothetical protein
MLVNAYKKIIQATILLLFFVTSLIASAKELYADELNIDTLISDIQGSDWHSRLPLYGGAEGIKNDRLTDALIGLVENKLLNWRYRIRAIQLLGESRKEKALNFLERILSDPFLNHDCPAIKWNAVTALGNFKNYAKVVDVLIDALNDKTLYVREAAIQSLGEIGSRKAVPYLISALSDKSFAIRISAIKALGKIGDGSAIPFVKGTLGNDTDPHIRDEAAKALRKLNET